MSEQAQDLNDVLNDFNDSEFANEAVDMNKQAIEFVDTLEGQMSALRDELVKQGKPTATCDEVKGLLEQCRADLAAVETEPGGHGEDAFFNLFKTGMETITIAERIYTEIVPKCQAIEQEIVNNG